MEPRGTRDAGLPPAGPPAELSAADVVARVEGEFWVLELFNRYKKKSRGYLADRTSVLAVLDRMGQPVELRWENEWTEVTPGIDLRLGRDNEQPAERPDLEVVHTGSVRIWARACPVWVQVQRSHEYLEYDDSRNCSCEGWNYWIRCEAARTEPAGSSGEG